MLHLAVVLLCCLIAGSSAQIPCCGPRQFQALHAVRFSPNGTFHEAFSTLAFDFTRQMVASNETLIGSREVMHQRVLVDGAKRTMYIVDHHSRECRIIALSHGIDAPCVPNNFRGEGTLYIGAGADLLNFNSFRGRVGELEAQISVTKATCIPVSQAVFSERFHETQSFVNVTVGIRDPSVFRIPPECTRAGLSVTRLSQQQLRAASPLMKSVFLGGGF